VAYAQLHPDRIASSVAASLLISTLNHDLAILYIFPSGYPMSIDVNPGLPGSCFVNTFIAAGGNCYHTISPMTASYLGLAMDLTISAITKFVRLVNKAHKASRWYIITTTGSAPVPSMPAGYYRRLCRL